MKDTARLRNWISIKNTLFKDKDSFLSKRVASQSVKVYHHKAIGSGVFD
ncbi:MAG: hypothetical protein SFU99_09030 [Saprospiraceae bacterium]|nr:hypothetical protein [Saprospiraceae bacterium]